MQLPTKIMAMGVQALKTNVSTISLPYVLNFAMTYECNSRCKTCNIWTIHRKKEELTLEEIRTFAKNNNFFRWIRLTGGEPWLRDDIVEIARAFKENSKDLYMMTMAVNSLVSREKVINGIKSILELQIPRTTITVSLDGYRELHDKIRGIPGNYDRAIAMYKALTELKKQYPNLYYVFGYTMSSYNEGQFEKTYQEVKKEIPEIKHNDFHVNIAHSSTNYYQNPEMQDLKPSKVYPEEVKQIIKAREFEVGVIHTIEDIYLKKSIEYYNTGKTPMDCKSLNASIFLDPYGFLYPCTMWYRKLANIRDVNYDIRNVWETEEAKSQRKDIKEKKCPNCWTPCEAHQTIVGNITEAIMST
ncbi:MAG: radical SAM/SPASM domain-containing protein [Candidatus Micrarchaeales archaeon]